MVQYQVCRLLKEYRKRAKLSQEILSDGLCEVSTLSRIERGVVVPNRKLLQALFERLGIRLPALDIPLTDDDFQKYNIETKIQNKISCNDYEIDELLTEYNSLKNKNDRMEEQFYQFYDALYKMRHHYDNEQVLEQFVKAMQITFPDFSRDSDLTKNLLTIQEMLILDNLAIVEFFMDYKEAAIKRMLFLKEYLENHEVDEQFKLKQYHVFIFNLSNWYGLTRDIKKGLEYAEKGIEITSKNGSLNYFPFFVFNKGYSLSLLGRTEEGKEFIKLAFDIFKCTGRIDDYLYGAKTVNKQFGFDFPEKN